MARPTSEIPGPRLPRPLQTLLGVGRPMAARLAMRRRYGRLFRTNDVFAGQMIHVADRALIEEMFKWKPAQYRVSEPRQIMEPVTGPESILLLDGDRHMRMRKLMLPPFHGGDWAVRGADQGDHRSRDRRLARRPDHPDADGRADGHARGDHPRRVRDHRSRPDRGVQAAPAQAVLGEPGAAAGAKGPGPMEPVGALPRSSRPRGRDALRRDRAPARRA